MRDEGSCLGAFLFLILVVAAFFGGCNTGRDTERAAAVEADVAEYRADPKTGTTSFVYRKPKGAARAD